MFTASITRSAIASVRPGWHGSDKHVCACALGVRQARRIAPDIATRLLEVNRDRIVDQRLDAVFPEMQLQRLALLARHHEQVMNMLLRIARQRQHTHAGILHPCAYRRATSRRR